LVKKNTSFLLQLRLFIGLCYLMTSPVLLHKEH